MKAVYYFYITILLICLHQTALAQQPYLQGRVINQDKEPIVFASVHFEELKSTISTDNEGRFSIKLPVKSQDLHIRVSAVGMRTRLLLIKKQDLAKPVFITMEGLSYTLEEINVRPIYESTLNSNSSIVFDEEAIEKIQAFSLMDILNTIPGKATTAPTIDAPQTITLRGIQGGAYDLNNSLGVPIIMDGIYLSNDANMQARAFSQWGMSSAALGGANGTSGGDVPFTGIDLREIPVETIEKVEIIQGVASAKYGELTDGAILIDRKAAKTPYSFVTNINGGSSNFSVSKGFDLKKKLGALNLAINYAISNPDPKDRIKQFDRWNTSLMWTVSPVKNIKNTLSIDYGFRNDEMKFDPDDADQQTSLTKNTNFRISNRLNIDFEDKFVNQANFSISYSKGSQHSYKQWLLNQLPRGYAYKDTTGIYEGVVLSGRYIAEEEILGKPITGSVNLNLSSKIETGEILHFLSYGFSGNYSNNGGQGIIADPDKPRWINQNGQNARPYSFQYLDPLINYGFFFSDSFNLSLGNRKLISNLGLRLDQQNGSWSLQPRLSTTLRWNSNLNFNAAFGISTKSPTMVHRYPPPTFLDIPLILAYNSEDALYLVYTEKFLADNSHLKPSKSSQFEVGARYQTKTFSTSLNAFFKSNKDGFHTVQSYRKITVPEYTYQFDESLREITYQSTGKTIDYYNYGGYKMGNHLNSNSYGVDWMLNINKIKAIESSFNMSNSFIVSEENNKSFDVVNLIQPIKINSESIWYLAYPPKSNNKKLNMLSKFGSTTHIPKLGFVIMANFDLFWYNMTKSKYGTKTQQAIGYFGSDMNLLPFPEDLDQIPVRDVTLNNSNQPFIYGCLNLSVAKEIKKKFRIAVTAYNVLNIEPEHIEYSSSNSEIFTVNKYNSPLSITGGISFKF